MFKFFSRKKNKDIGELRSKSDEALEILTSEQLKEVLNESLKSLGPINALANLNNGENS